MISTQRLLLIIIAMNMIIGLVTEIYIDNSYSDEIIINRVNMGQEYATDLEEEDTKARPTSTTQLDDATRGSTLTASLKIFGIFLKGLDPFPFDEETFDTQIENTVAAILMFFKILMYTLIGVEIYMLFKNKKTG